MTRINKPVLWSQGLFLKPQHFQLLDLYNQSLFRPLFDNVQPSFWGVTNLQIHDSLLSSRQFEIASGEFLFPDGTFIQYPGNATIKPRSFESDWKDTDKPFRIYLGVRNTDYNRSNVTVVANPDEMATAVTRFAATHETEEAPDLHGSGPGAQVQHLTHVVRLFWGNEKDKLDNYSFIPIAELKRSGDQIICSPSYIPPSLTIGSSELMMEVVRDIRDQLASRSRQLEQYKDPKNVQAMTLALLVLSRNVPLFSQLCETRDVHPWFAYSYLRQLAGELTVFSNLITASGEKPDGTLAIPAYDHRALGDCFLKTHEWLVKLLDAVLAGPEYAVRLSFDGNFFVADIPHDFFGRSNRFWLLVQSSMDPEQVVVDMTRMVKLATLQHLPSYIARAVPAIGIVHHPGVPAGLPQRGSTQYFQIDTSNRLWSEVMSSQRIALFWDAAPSDAQLEIIVLKE